VHISATFDSGNIEVVDASDPTNVQLKIRRDAGEDHMQWFHFRMGGARGEPVTMRIVNAHESSYPKAWNNYQAVASYDREYWFRVPTTYEDGALVIQHEPDLDMVWYAYFAPYSHERHLDLIALCQVADGVNVDVVGQSLDGNDIEMLTVGDGPLQLWLIARQHPGESMAEWWMEGFLARLLDTDDALAMQLRRLATFRIVPNMNPDGSQRGHLRNNAAGANLNREWHEPTAERSPEVLAVRNCMDQTGCDFCLDVHGDEELPYNFVSGAEGIEGWTKVQAALQEAFLYAYVAANPDFQTKFGYGVDEPGTANMTMCTNQIASRFDCLAMTLEMPFKDTADTPNPQQGWSPERAVSLGASALHPIAAVIGNLRS